MTASESKTGKGKWAATSAIAVALLTSFGSITVAVITSDSLDSRLEQEGKTHDEKVEASATGAAVDVLWLRERIQRIEVELAVEKVLRKVAEERLDRVENRLFHRSGGGRPTAASRRINLVEIMAKAKEEVEKRRPPKPKVEDARVQQTLDVYLGKKK